MKNDIHPALRAALEKELREQVVNDLLLRLIEGSRRSGVSLSEQDCKILLAELRPKPKPARGRPSADWDRQYNIAMTCISYQWCGLTTRAAVAATAEQLKISPSTVWNARKLFDRSK
jgi:hypothetical protein